jgi:FHA domain
MPHIRLDDNEIELSVGELRIGTGDEAQVRLDAGPEKGILAIIIVDPRGTATVRRQSTGTTILVNGVALGAEPAPLLHGDRIEVAGRQLRFSDESKAGSTVLLPALAAPAALVVAPNRGRVNASRRRARVSANGVFVNGARIGEAQSLRRGDVIRIGTEEFRFYADRAADAPVMAPLSEAAASAGEVVSREASTLATLEVVNEGATKGTLYQQTLGSRAAVRFGGVKVIFRSEPEAIDADGGTRVIVGFRPSDQQRAPAARPIVATRDTEAGDSTRSARISPLVWIAAALVIGATVLLVIQDRS